MKDNRATESAIEAAIAAWVDASRAAKAMQALFAATVCLAAFIAAFALARPRRPEFASFNVQDLFLDILLNGLWSLAYTPLLIATHRYVLLGQISHLSDIGRPAGRTIAFFVFSFLFGLIFVVIDILSVGVTWLVGDGFSLLVSFPAMVAAWALALRLLILFPAIAVDAPDATGRRALLDSQGKTWSILARVAATCVPFVMMALLYFLLFFRDLTAPPLWSARSIIWCLAWAIVSVLTAAAMAALASRLFRTFGQSLVKAN